MTFSTFKMLCKYYPKQSAGSNVIAISLNDFFCMCDRNRKIHPKIHMESQKNSQKKKKKTLKKNKIEGLTHLDFKT